MPIAYRFYPHVRVVVITGDGNLTPGDVLRCRETMVAHRDHDPTLDRLYDFRRVRELKVDPAAMISLAATAQSPDLSSAGKTAVVVSTDAIYGQSRQLEAHLPGDASRRWKTFRTLEKAQEWLGLSDWPGPL